MAQRGTPLGAGKVRVIVSTRGALSVRRCAREVGVSPTTVQKYRTGARGQPAVNPAAPA